MIAARVTNLMAMMKDAAEVVPSVMQDPAADWVPVVTYEDGKGEFHTRGLPRAALGAEGIVESAREIKSLLGCAAARQAALLLPTYFTRIDDGGAAPVERVLITLVTRDGVECEAARVVRSVDAPPRLRHWDVYAVDSDVGPGIFVDAMREAIG